MSTVISEEPLQQGGEAEGRDGESQAADGNNDESGTAGGQTQGLQDTRYIIIKFNNIVL